MGVPSYFIIFLLFIHLNVQPLQVISLPRGFAAEPRWGWWKGVTVMGGGGTQKNKICFAGG